MYQVYKEELEEALSQVLRSGIYLNGPKTKEIEETLASYLGVKYAIGVASGTEALYLILKALELPKNSYILVPSFTFIASAEVIVRAGQIPYFIDIDENTYNLSLESLEEAFKRIIQKRKKISGVLVVSLFGLPADLESLESFCKEKNLYLIEDICQAFGAQIKEKKVGTFGIASATSFYPTKPLSAFGDAGMVFTNDEKLAWTVRILKEHGQTKPYFYEYHGQNGRIDELQCAILQVKFKYFEKELSLREKIVKKYLEGLKDLQSYLSFPQFPPGYRSSYALFTLRAKEREELRKFLKEKNIETGVYYPLPLHLQPIYRNLGFKEGTLPVSERVSQEVLSLPLFPYLQDEEIDYIINTIKSFYQTFRE
ncbi:MAG: DegT/DnrJ/EryC1/StrS family aminotransferase [Thermodesulfobacteriaceae bacterium]|nr:DegT/DnrJ/EryC1/StrS family aminotransferase [Thermodesulfobacteriaceae bacterium]